MIPTRHISALPQCLFGLVLICWPLLDTDSLAVVRQLDHIRYFVKGEPGLADLQGNTLTAPIFDFIFPIYQGAPVLFEVEREGQYGILEPSRMQLIIPLHDCPNIDALIRRVREFPAVP